MDQEQEKILFQATLCILVKDTKVLLARKMKKIGAGLWNGYGGGIEPGETPIQAAVRELHEEAGINLESNKLEKVAYITFCNKTSDSHEFICIMHVYLIHVSDSDLENIDIKETDEMHTPTWFESNNLPFNEMLAADREWLPLVLTGKKIIGTAYYTPKQHSLEKPSVWQEAQTIPE